MSKQKSNYLYLTGSDGLYQTTFPSSPKGQKGARGYNGTDGTKGARGDKGSDGKAGRLTQIVGSFGTNTPNNLPKNGTLPVGWDDGVNPPVPFDVEIGETLYYTTGQELWTYTPGSTVSCWTMIGSAQSIKGQPGLKGPSGDKGQKGIPGIEGDDGFPGQKGQKGELGTKGDDGTKGQKGQRGDTGAAGSNGARGTKGNPGSDGSDGTNGVNGTKGQKGNFGVKGQRGVMGPRGLKGETGDPGESTWFPRLAASFSGETLEVYDAYGLLSVDKLQEGEYRVNFSKALSNNRYTVTAVASRKNFVVIGPRKTDSVVVKVKDVNNNLSDTDYVSIIIYKYAA